MKIKFSALLICYNCISLAQSGSSGFKIESVYVLSGKETIFQGQPFNNVSNAYTNSPFSLPDDSVYTHNRFTDGGEYRSHSAEISLRKENSKWRFIMGASYYKRTDWSALSYKTYHTILDTLYMPVPSYYMIDDEFVYSISYDSVYLDSSARYDLAAESITKNFLISGELLYDIKKNKFTISSGVGLGIGMSLKNQIAHTHNQFWGLQMVDNIDGDYREEVWYADIMEYNPVQGSYTRDDFTQIRIEHANTRGNAVFQIRPYIPLRIEATFAEKGFFSKVGVVGSLNGGVEFQFEKDANTRSRFFWNYRAGLFFRI